MSEADCRGGVDACQSRWGPLPDEVRRDSLIPPSAASVNGACFPANACCSFVKRRTSALSCWAKTRTAESASGRLSRFLSARKVTLTRTFCQAALCHHPMSFAIAGSGCWATRQTGRGPRTESRKALWVHEICPAVPCPIVTAAATRSSPVCSAAAGHHGRHSPGGAI